MTDRTLITETDLSCVRDQWHYDQEYCCWCLENLSYTQKPSVPEVQRMSIFVPCAYLNADGTVNPTGVCGHYTGATAPVIFENNVSGYRQMPPTRLGGPRDEAPKYLHRGMVYVTCGCRGRESRDENGVLCGKAPWALVDLKTAIRFLRHNAAVLPGDMGHIISVGWSAGGAMSALISVTGDHPDYLPYLERNGAFLDESDAVFAGQIYCPIIDLDHADLAYEWQFQKDPENEQSHVGPAGRFTPFQEALSRTLAADYIDYFNALGLKHPATGKPLTLNRDGRSGSAYDYLMICLEDSATDYLTRLDRGMIPGGFSVADYLLGHGSSPGIPNGDKTAWLHWDGERARLSGLDDYILNHRRRMKPCTSFDILSGKSGENQVLGSPERDYLHFSEDIAPALDALQNAFPEETSRLSGEWSGVAGDCALAERRRLINPMGFLENPDACHPARFYRIHVGAFDADTAFTVSMALAVRLANLGKDVEYRLIWDQPHCEADYPCEVCDWVERICRP